MKNELYLVDQMSLYATRLELLSLLLDDNLETVNPLFSSRDTLHSELRCLVVDQLKSLALSCFDDIKKVGRDL